MARKIEVQIVGDSSSLHKALGSVSTRTSRFGKALGTSFRAGSVVATAGLVGLGFAAKDLFQDFSDGQKATAQTNAVLKSTGGAANVTTKHVQDLATTIQGYSGIQDDAVQSGENMLLTFKNIRNEAGKGNKVFDESTKILADMSQATGQDMTKSAIQLGKALNDPVKGITALQRVGVTFTQGQKDSIAAMVKSGNTMGAQKVILKELQSEFGGSARAAGTTFAGQMNILKGAFENAGSAIIGKLLPYLTRFAQFVVPIAIKGVDLLGQAITRLIGFFAGLGGKVGVSSGRIHSAFGAVVDFFQSRVMPVVRQLKDIFAQAFANIAHVVVAHGAEIHRIVQRVGAVLQAVAKVAIPILKFALTKVLPIAIGMAITWLDKATAGIAKILGTAIRVGKNIGKHLQGVFHAAQTMWEDVSPILSSMWGAFTSIASAVQSIIDKIDTLHQKVASVKGPSLLDLIPHAAGGSVSPGKTYLVGERGPELFRSSSAGSIIPNHRLGVAGGGNMTVTVPVYLDGREIARSQIRLDKDYRRQNAGRGLFSGSSSG